jgi:hypothetical protein
MDDGDEVVAKLPNPNAGPPFYTLSSEVATRHFVSDGAIDASCKYTLFTDGILLTWNTAPISVLCFVANSVSGTNSSDYAREIGTKELQWTKSYAQPRMNFHRSMEHPETPGHYTSLLQRYLTLAPYLVSTFPDSAHLGPYSIQTFILTISLSTLQRNKSRH